MLVFSTEDIIDAKNRLDPTQEMQEHSASSSRNQPPEDQKVELLPSHDETGHV